MFVIFRVHDEKKIYLILQKMQNNEINTEGRDEQIHTLQLLCHFITSCIDYSLIMCFSGM